MNTVPTEIIITGNEARKIYFFKVMLQLLIGAAYLFGIMNFVANKPPINGLFNLIFGVIFTIIFFTRNKHLELSLLLGGIFFQIFIFGHSYFLLPGKQIEIGFGVLTAILPVFVGGYRLWFFFIGNLILFHIVLFGVGYENTFIFQYGFYIVMFVFINTIYKENQEYERALIIQKDKIKRDAEILQEADELKTRFFANISHELRTPLTLLLSPMEIILNSNELSNRNYTYFQLMQQNGQKLLKRINELLELSRLGAKKLEIKEEAVNIYQLTKQIAATYESVAKLKNVTLDYINEIADTTNLKLDIPKVEMIVSNYLSNAIKFTPKDGKITLRVSKVANSLQISVQDTGIGIPKEGLEKVFNRFYQVKRADYKEGTGIGLALCKELAELHRGKVWVESEIGKGSIFFVQLPFKETFDDVETTEDVTNKPIESIESIKQKDKEITSFSKLHRQMVLVVEDNADLRSYMELLLSDEYEVITIKNGKEALEWLADSSFNRQPSLIISDIMMPIMDGITLLKALKNTDEFRHIPVIMLTAQKHTDVKIDALRIGVDDYLTKPFEVQELLARVRNLIENTTQRITAIPTVKTTKRDTTVTAFDIQWLKTVEDKILENISDNKFTLNHLAAEINVSTRTLQLKIKAITGQTPKKYQRSIQLHHARKLLKSGEIKTVSELSYQLGFEDQHYFSTLYKKEFGVTPRQELK